MKTYVGVGVLLYPFLTSALDGGEWSYSCPGHITPGERGFVGPRGGLDAVGK